MDRDVFVAVLRRSSAAGLTVEARAIELATGQTRVLYPLADFELVIEDVRDSVVLLREVDDLGGGDAHVRLLRVGWKDPTNAEVLEEEDLSGLHGGDAWNPWPYARTNGRDVAWLRATDVLSPYEIVLLGANGQERTVATTDQPTYFDLDDSGRVAIAALTTDKARQDLQVFDGRLRQLSTRPADGAGFVMSFPDLAGWTRGLGVVRPPTEVELIPIAGGPPRAARAETGCVVVGATAKDVVTVCTAGVRLIDVASGAVRDGPAGRIVQAFHRGLLWRTSADLVTNPEVWRVTPL
jgi:hypothetical protein